MTLYEWGGLLFSAVIDLSNRSLGKAIDFGKALERLCFAGQVLWSRAAAPPTIGFPAEYFGTSGFLALCVAASFHVFWSGYKWRARATARQIRHELRLRLRQHEKNVDEAYDDLLQAMQGLLLRFQVVSDQVVPLTLSRAALEEVMDQAEFLIVEHRNKISDSRSRDGEDLPGLLLSLANALATGPPVDVRLTIEGAPRPIQPAALEAIKRIACEALSNSYRHAQANNIEISVVYHRNWLIVQLGDDGVGLDQIRVDEGGLNDRRGLLGMRARASLIGGDYSFSSRSNAGTMVQFRLQREIAYRNAPIAAA
jgi:signal transduction histidine kinase